MNDSSARPIDAWFARYADDHRHPVNQRIHLVAVPLILWSAVALLWCVPVPAGLARPGLWAALAMFLAWMFYYRASHAIGFGMLAVLVAMAWLTRWLHDLLGTPGLARLALAVCLLAWIAQFVGHSRLYEGRKPSFLTDLRYLLVGPAWVLSKAYRRLGWAW